MKASNTTGLIRRITYCAIHTHLLATLFQSHFVSLKPAQEHLFLLLKDRVVNVYLYSLAKAHFIGKYSCYTTNPASADCKN